MSCSCAGKGFEFCGCAVPKTHVMPWGTMRVFVNGVPVRFGHTVTVAYDQMRKEWDLHIRLNEEPAPEPVRTLSDAIRHWAQGDS